MHCLAWRGPDSACGRRGLPEAGPAGRRRSGAAVGVLGSDEAALSANAAILFGRTHQSDLSDHAVGVGAGRVDVTSTFAPLDQAGVAVREERCFAAL